MGYSLLWCAGFVHWRVATCQKQEATTSNVSFSSVPHLHFCPCHSVLCKWDTVLSMKGMLSVNNLYHGYCIYGCTDFVLK